MIDILLCAVYLAFLGSASFFLGRLLPKGMFGDNAYFRMHDFEKKGRIYERLGIKRWKDKLPDMSKIFPSMLPAKNGFADVDTDVMIRETRVAEFVHAAIAVLGFPCVVIARGAAGWIMWILWALGNVPFIMVQRYNRPRLERLCAVRKRHAEGRSRA